MPPMEGVVPAVTLVMAAVLLWAGLEKARGLASFVSTIRELGAPAGIAKVAAPLLASMEIAVAFGLILRPGSIVTLGGVLVLAVLFAASGLIAVSRRQVIRCGCFGPGGRGTLGKRQIAAVPLWLGAVALVWLEGPPNPSAAAAASSLAAVGLTIAAIRGVAVARASLRARGDRRSAQEMYAWLQR